jgi:hypothetical protein
MLGLGMPKTMGAFVIENNWAKVVDHLSGFLSSDTDAAQAKENAAFSGMHGSEAERSIGTRSLPSGLLRSKKTSYSFELA